MPRLAEGTPLSPAARAALEAATVTAGSVQLHTQLDRPDYEQVNAVPERLGGTWSRRDRAHRFNATHNPAAGLAAVLDTGLLPPDPKREWGWFATPPQLALDMADTGLGYLDNGRQVHQQRVLEPSAGEGALVDAAVSLGVDPGNVVCVEPHPHRAAVLRAKGYRTHTTRFQAWAIRHQGEQAFDVILMNPPFTEVDDKRAWITHLDLAWRLLANGDRLVAIAPASLAHGTDRATTAIRARVQQHGEWHVLPGDAFKSSGTSVFTVQVVMDRSLTAPDDPPLELPPPAAPGEQGALFAT